MHNKTIREDIKEITSHDNVSWNDFAGKTILITGGNGMLASYMIDTLLFLNDNVLPKKCMVLCLARNKNATKKRFKYALQRNDITFMYQDVCVPLSYAGTIDFVIHAASQASPKYYGVDPVGTLDANLSGTKHLLELSRKKQVKAYLFVSSSEVYGAMPNHVRAIHEQDFGFIDPMTVRACYAESKRAGETLCLAYHHQFGVPIKVVRPFHTYGPSMRLDDGRVYADFVANIIHNENIHLNSDGAALRSFCYITDATVAFFMTLLKGIPGHAYNMGNPEQEQSIYELAQTLVHLFPEKGLKVTRNFTPPAPGYVASTVNRNQPDITKLQNLGWTPGVSLDEGFKRTIEALS